MDRALEQLVRFLGTDRATLIEWPSDGDRFVVTHSWARPGAPEFPIGFTATTGLPAYTRRLAAGETLRYERLPDDLHRDMRAEALVVERDSLRSHVAVPLAVGGRWVCALCTATVHEFHTWSDLEVKRIRIVGQMLANALDRSRLEAGLRASLAETRAFQERLRAENEYLREEIVSEAGFEEIVGRSAAVRRVLEQAAQVADTPVSVLLLGETGTGKELLARAIHGRSARREDTFVKLNCAAFPASLVESELFGHEKGAFTGATSAKPGRFELADGGHALPRRGRRAAAARCRRSCCASSRTESSSAWRSVRTRKVDVRIVAATNRDLDRAMAEGRFREDLYYRLAAFPIHLPPLRDRREDIPLLVWHHVHRRQAELGRRIKEIPESAMQALTSYAWPGNVRELRNVLDRALVISRTPVLELAQSLAPGIEHKAPADALSEVERQHVLHVLNRCGWTINGPGNAADVLGLHPNTLRSRMKKLHIERPARA